jgi:hypothetical protein
MVEGSPCRQLTLQEADTVHQFRSLAKSERPGEMPAVGSGWQVAARLVRGVVCARRREMIVSVGGTNCTRALVPTFVSRAPARKPLQQKTSYIVGTGAVFTVQMLSQRFKWRAT